MSRSRESRPRGSRKQQTKITYAARARTLNRFKKSSWGTEIRSLSSFSLGGAQTYGKKQSQNKIRIYDWSNLAENKMVTEI